MIAIFVALIFICFGIAVLQRPAVIVALAVGMYAFEQWAQANSSFFGRHSSLVQLAFGILSLMALVAVAARGRNPLSPLTGGMICFALLYIYAGFSVVWSLDRDLAMFLFQYHAPYMITFGFIVPLSIQNRSDLYQGMIATLVFGSIVLGLLLFGTQVHGWGRTILAEGVSDRVGGVSTRLAPLAIAEMAGQILIIAFIMNFRGIHRVWQYARLGVALLALALIVRSGSRGQLIAAILSLLVFIMFSRRATKASGWIAASVTASLVLGFTVMSFAGYADSDRWQVANMGRQFSSTRLEFVSRLFTFWVQSSPVNWIIGLGSSASYDVRIIGRYCHVVAVEILCELGLIGVTLASCLIFFVVRDLVRLWKITKNDDVDRGLTATLAAVFFFQVMLSFKQGSVLTHSFTWCWAMIITRHAAAMRLAHYKEKGQLRRWMAYQAMAWRNPQFAATDARPTP